jgi:outer membrane protein OmpU
MKRILLASVATVAFAGAAAAEITFGAEATLGFNNSTVGDNYGFYWSADLNLGFASELDNGLTAGGTLTIELANDNLGQSLEAGDFEFYMITDDSGLYFGDTAFAAETRWDFAGSLIADVFSEQSNEVALRGDYTWNDIGFSLGGNLADGSEDFDVGGGKIRAPDFIDQLSIGAGGQVGAFTFSIAYQEESAAYCATGTPSDFEEDTTDDGVDNPTPILCTNNSVPQNQGVYAAYDDFNTAEVFGISAGTVFSGFSVQLAYVENLSDSVNNIGLAVGYTIGDLALNAYYSLNNAPVDNVDVVGDNWGISAAYTSGAILVEASYETDTFNDEDWGIDLGYDIGNGFLVAAGLDDNGDSYYIAGLIDIAGEDDLGASVGISYAVDESYDPAEDAGDDEIGKFDLQEGLTAEVTFNF